MSIKNKKNHILTQDLILMGTDYNQIDVNINKIKK